MSEDREESSRLTKAQKRPFDDPDERGAIRLMLAKWNRWEWLIGLSGKTLAWVFGVIVAVWAARDLIVKFIAVINGVFLG